MTKIKVPQISAIWRHKNEGLSISFVGVLFPPLTHFYDVTWLIFESLCPISSNYYYLVNESEFSIINWNTNWQVHIFWIIDNLLEWFYAIFLFVAISLESERIITSINDVQVYFYFGWGVKKLKIFFFLGGGDLYIKKARMSKLFYLGWEEVKIKIWECQIHFFWEGK